MLARRARVSTMRAHASRTPPMLLQTLWFAIGLAALYLAAEWLVRGSSRIARMLGVSPVVIALTVVAFGTSAPELVVSSIATLRGQSDVSIGNIVGSNIMNIALILGVCAIITPVHVERSLIRREIPIMIGSALLIPILGYDGVAGRIDAVILLVAFVAFTWSAIRMARSEPEAAAAELRELEEIAGSGDEAGSPLRNWFLVIAGIAGLVIGAHLLVTSAVFFAKILGVSELVIGLTIVAVGTSLPEMATSVVAARRGEPEIALGNVIGSNIFNVLLILGAASALAPITVDPGLLRFEMPINIGVSVVLIPLTWRSARLGRRAGALLLITYIAFTVLLLVRTGAV